MWGARVGVGVCRGQEILGYNTHNIQHTYNKEQASYTLQARTWERLRHSILFPRSEGKEVSWYDEEQEGAPTCWAPHCEGRTGAFLLAPPPPRDMWVCLAWRGERRAKDCFLFLWQRATTQNTPSFRSLFTSLCANNVSTPWLIVHDQCFIHCQNFQTEEGMFYLFSLKIFQTSLFIFCDIYRVSQLHRGLLGFTSGL